MVTRREGARFTGLIERVKGDESTDYVDPSRDAIRSSSDCAVGTALADEYESVHRMSNN